MEKDFEDGMSEMKRENYSAAIRFFSKCIDENPKNLEALLQRGIAKSYLPGNIGSSSILDETNDFTLVIISNPNCYEAYNGRGLAYWNLENYEMAILDYSKAIEIRPLVTKNYLDRADSYINLNQFSKALIDLNYYIENEKDSKDILWAYENRALVHSKLKDFKHAILDYNKTLLIDKNSKCHIDRAQTYFALGKNQEATIDFMEVLKREPMDPKAIFFLELIEDVKKVKNITNERTLADYILSCHELFGDHDHENLYKEANECVKVYSDFYLGYAFRAIVYSEKKEYYKLNIDLDISLNLKPGNKFALTIFEAIPPHLQRIGNPPISKSEIKEEKQYTNIFSKLFTTNVSSKKPIIECIEESLKRPIIEWVNIPSGTFIMGSPENEPERVYEPQCQVTISAFKMSKYEITFEQFDLFCEDTCRLKPTDDYWGHGKSCGRGKHPAVFVNWFEAQEFAAWMGCRLPTGAEWEYACRAGTTTAFNTGKNITTDEANYDGNYPYNKNIKGVNRGKPMPVGSFPPNSWGLYDMHGNVWEWCNDWCGEHPTTPQVNPQGPSTGKYRMIRGGSFCNSAHSARSASNAGDYPDNHRDRHGFRLVLIEKETL